MTQNQEPALITSQSNPSDASPEDQLKAKHQQLLQQIKALEQQDKATRQFFADWEQRLQLREQNVRKRENILSLREGHEIRNSELLDI